MTDKICGHCKGKGGIYRVEEAAVRGGSYDSCRYCGELYEDFPWPTLPSRPSDEVKVSKGKYAKY